MQILDCYYIFNHQEHHPTVFLVGKDKNGKLRTIKTEHHYPYFYAVGDLPSWVERHGKVKDVEEVERYKPIGYQIKPTPMWKIFLYNPADTVEIRDALLNRGLTVYEADILYKYRYMVDHGLGGMSWTDDGIHFVDNQYNAPLKSMAFDIEVLLNEAGNFPKSSPTIDGKGKLLRDGDPIVIITMAFSDGSVKLLKNENGDEKALLESFVDEINAFDPDLIVTYNGDSFDWPYLMDRAQINEVPIAICRDKSEPKMRELGDSNQFLIRGRVSLDMLPIIRKNYSLKNYKLGTSATLVNEEKLDVKPQEMRRLWLNKDTKFLDYAKQDANITLKLLLDLKLLEKYIALSRATGLLLQDVLYSGQSAMIENMFLKEFNLKNRVLAIKNRKKPNAPEVKKEPLNCVFGNYVEEVEEEDEGVQYEGATVLVPPKGLVEDTVVLDYKSLYPTIIISHNLSYDTILLDDSLDVAYEEAPKFTEEATRGPRFVDKTVLKGILPSILETLLNARLEAKRAMKAAEDGSLEKTLLDAKQYAFKILLNSYYGYCGYRNSRLFLLDIAASVTSYGRQNIEKTRQLVRDMGYETVYGDSVTGDRCVPIKDNNGMINVVPIEQLFDACPGDITHDMLTDKEYKTNVPYFTLTHLGWKPIQSVMRHITNKKIYRVNQKFGETVCTEDHSLMDINLQKTKPIDMASTSMYKCNVPDEIEIVDKLDLYEYVKHYTIGPVLSRILKFHVIDDKIVFGVTSTSSSIRYDRYISSNKLMSSCRLIGAYIAEGSSSTYIRKSGNIRSQSVIVSSDLNWIHKIASDYTALTNKIPHIKSRVDNRIGVKGMKYSTCYYMYMNDRTTTALLDALCGHNSHFKKLPAFIYNLDDIYKKSLLAVLIEGDGSTKFGLDKSERYAKNNFHYASISTELISGLSTLLSMLDINYTIQRNERTLVYTISTSSNMSCVIKTKIKETEYSGYVYDLDVEDAHTFCDACGNILLSNTDSLFVKTKVTDFDKSMEIADTIAKAATAQLPPPMELVPEAYCRRILFLAKKHYGCYRFEHKDKGKIKTKGLETVRRDWCEYTSETLNAILNTILIDGDTDKALEIARTAISKIKTGNLKDPDIFWKLVLSKKYGSDYKPGAETRLAHLILVEKMRKRNLMDYQVNDRVQYVVVTGASSLMSDDHRGKFREQAEDPEYAMEHDIELDRDYYIQKQLVKPIHRMLGVLGISEAMLLNSSIDRDRSTQKTLFDW